MLKNLIKYFYSVIIIFAISNSTYAYKNTIDKYPNEYNGKTIKIIPEPKDQGYGEADYYKKYYNNNDILIKQLIKYSADYIAKNNKTSYESEYNTDNKVIKETETYNDQITKQTGIYKRSVQALKNNRIKITDYYSGNKSIQFGIYKSESIINKSNGFKNQETITPLKKITNWLHLNKLTFFYNDDGSYVAEANYQKSSFRDKYPESYLKYESDPEDKSTFNFNFFNKNSKIITSFKLKGALTNFITADYIYQTVSLYGNADGSIKKAICYPEDKKIYDKKIITYKNGNPTSEKFYKKGILIENPYDIDDDDLIFFL